MTKTEQVVLAVARRLLERAPEPGERLPTLREVAAEQRVSIFVARSAMETLAEAGIIEARWGDGCYVKEVPGGKLRAIVAELGRRGAQSARRMRGVANAKVRVELAATIIHEGSAAFYGQYVQAVERVLRRAGVHCLLKYSEYSEALESDHVRLLLNDHIVNGFIIDPISRRRAPGYLPDLKRARVPAVFIGDLQFEDERDYDNLRCDNRAGMSGLMAHVLGLGHREVLYCDHPGSGGLASQTRYAVYREAMTARAFRVRDPFPIPGNAAVDAVRAEALREHFTRGGGRPTAIVCFNDVYALQCMRALALLGLRVPQDISVCGYDDREMVESMNPALTTVRYPREQIGEEAARRLLGKVSGDIPFDEYRQIEVKPALVVRETTAAPPARARRTAAARRGTQRG